MRLAFMDESINILYLEPIQLQSSTLSTRDPEEKWTCIAPVQTNPNPDPRQKGHIVEQLCYTYLFIVTQ